MSRLLHRRWLNLNAFADRSCLLVKICKLVLLLVCTLLVAMPWTQHLWTWDRFLHGGQDFETGLLLILTSLCLIPVLVRSCKAAMRCIWFCLKVLNIRPRALRHLLLTRRARTFRNGEGPPALPGPTGMVLPLLI